MNNHAIVRQLELENQNVLKKIRQITILATVISVVGSLIFVGTTWGMQQGRILSLENEVSRISITAATSKDIKNVETAITGLTNTLNERFRSVEQNLSRVEKKLDRQRQ